MKSIQMRNLARPALAAALTIASTALLAGPWGYHGLSGANGAGPVDRMAERLDLTEDQKREISAIFEQQRAERALARQETRAQIDALLTDEQRAVRDQALAERLDRRIERMSRRLDLTEEQQTAVRDILQQARTEPMLDRGALREQIAGVLTEEQQALLQQGPGRDGTRGRGGCARGLN